MRWILTFALLLFSPSVSCLVVERLPQADYADMETVTNVPFSVSVRGVGRFTFSLSCRATPSNNVEVAFGADGNGNGVLEVEEIDRVVGWDCGAWFTRRGADGEYVRSVSALTNDVRTLTWNLRLGSRGRPHTLSVVADGDAVFPDLSLAGAFDPAWNLLRLTGRGVDAELDGYSVSALPDGMAIVVR